MTVKDRATFTTMKKPENLICLSEGLFSFTGSLGQSHKVICSCWAVRKRESKDNKVWDGILKDTDKKNSLISKRLATYYWIFAIRLLAVDVDMMLQLKKK